MHVVQAISTSNPVAIAQPLEQRWVGKLFKRLNGQFGAKMADLYGGAAPDAVQEQWAWGLAGFSPEEILRGLAEARTRRFAPNIGEFAQMCRPCLDPEMAWLEAVEGLQARERGDVGVWTHPAVYRAASRMAYEVRTFGFSMAMRKRWERTLKQELALGWGDEVPPVPQRITNNPTTVSMPSSIRRKLAQLGVKPGGVK